MNTKWIISLIVIVLIFAGSGWYGYDRYNFLNSKIDNLAVKVQLLQTDVSSTTIELKGNISQTRSDLSNAINQETQNTQDKLSSVEGRVGSLSGTLNNLEKLSKTDPELLQKYSKVFFLNEHYSPPRLVEIPDNYDYVESKINKIHADVFPFLKLMLDSAASNSINLYVFSAFRSFNEQTAVKGKYSVTYGSGTANQFSADQGYSEHQLGTTVDFMTSGIGGVLEKFDGTKAQIWLNANAYKYGFILSYPKNNSYYVYEPWHWRFVGVKLANDLHNSGKNFYDLDQRDIDKYLIDIF